MGDLKKFKLDKCFENVKCGDKAQMSRELMEAMCIRSRMTLLKRRKAGYTPKRGEDEAILRVLEKFGVRGYMIEE